MNITDLSATELSARVAEGSLLPSRIMAAYLERIAALNGPLNALVSLRGSDELMFEARAADRQAARGPLHGIPFAVKDLVATKGIRTTSGSTIYAEHVPDEDGLLAARLRSAGAIFIGKTNTPEWGHGSHTFNPVHGVTRNPYDPNRSAGGSSGGAAAALAARLVPIADGSDMMGSLRNPAAFCNVYGFRPTWGLVPQDADGDVFLHTLSTDGPMARTIEDLALLLTVIAGPNPETPFDRPREDFNIGPDLQPVCGMRIGWLGDWGGAYPCEPGILEQCSQAIRVYQDLGASVEPVAPPFAAQDLWHSWTTLRAMLNANSMGSLYEDPATRAQIKPETIWEIEQGRGLSASAVYDASVIRSRWYAKAAQLFQRYDALAMPAAQVWPFPIEWRWPQHINGRVMDTYHRWMEIVVPVSLIGLPSLCLPAGFGETGLPMGVQLFGPCGADKKILAMGQAYHRLTDWPGRCPPKS